MPNKCACGGRFAPFRSTPEAFTWQCGLCKKQVTQAKRLPETPPNEHTKVLTPNK